MFTDRDISVFKSDFMRQKAVFELEEISVQFETNARIVFDGVETTGPVVTFAKGDVEEFGIKQDGEITINDVPYKIGILLSDDGFFVARKLENIE